MKKQGFPKDGDVISCPICGRKVCYQKPETMHEDFRSRICTRCWGVEDLICPSCTQEDEHGNKLCTTSCLEFGNKGFKDMLLLEARNRDPGYNVIRIKDICETMPTKEPRHLIGRSTNMFGQIVIEYYHVQKL